LNRIRAHLADMLFVSGLMLFIPVVVGIIYGEYVESLYFVIIAVVTTTSGLAVGQRYPLRETSILEAMVIAAGTWLLIAFIGSIPFILIMQLPPLDAYFEAMSGFTTTGMTLIPDPAQLPHSLLFWRAFIQWIGGVGIVLLFLLFITPSGLGAGVLRLYRAEAREERTAAKTESVIRQIWGIYALYTAICAILLLFGGLTPFDAVTHSFTTLSTGGFSTQSQSIEGFHNLWIEITLVVFMFIGGTNFMVHLRMFHKGPKAFLTNIEVKVALLIITISSLIIAGDLVWHQLYGVAESFRYSIFQVVSIMTTTGYTTANITMFPSLSNGILHILMAVGGNIGSTGGAIKIMRIIILAKLAHHILIKTILPPGTVKPIKVGDHIIKEEEAFRVGGFFVIYILLILVEGLILAAFGFDLTSSFSGAVSAQGNIGPSLFPVASSLPAIPKIVLIFGMWVGRLEILPALILLMPATWKEFARLRKRET